MTTASLESLAETWDVIFDPPVESTPDGLLTFGMRHGKPVALKKLGTTFDAEGSAAALSCFDGHGGVHVLDSRDGWVLMERLYPGTSLEETFDDQGTHKDVAIFCETVSRLHTADLCDTLPHLKSWTRSFESWRKDMHPRLTRPLVRDAALVIDSLIESTTQVVVLHGDLHHGNIVLDHNQGWLAIDPKGVAGDPAFEAAAFLRNPMECLSEVSQRSVAEGRVTLMCDLTGWDKTRVIRWAFAQNVISAIWSAQANEDPGPTLDLVNTLQVLMA